MRTLAVVFLLGAALLGFRTAEGQSFQPGVPVSAFARPAAWLDPDRLQVSAELMMGTGFGARGVSGLQVTRFQYRIADPLAVQVGLGNAFGSGSLGSGSFFLESLHLSYQPFRLLNVQVHYQDVRTPLQYSRYGYWR